MPRTPKEAPKGSSTAAGRAEEKAEPSPPEALQAALQSARADLMRAQRDLESVRLELVEQKRKSSQHALVHAEELKEARSTRDQIRMQLDALRAELAAPAKKRRREDDGRVEGLEQELAEMRAELKELRGRSAPPPTGPSEGERELRTSLAKLQAAHSRSEAALAEARSSLAEARSELAKARSELTARRIAPAAATFTAPPAPARAEIPAPAAVAPVPAAVAPDPVPDPAADAPAAAVSPEAPASAPRGFFSKLFGRRSPA
jgi:chromosome segregation ATPase